MPTQEQIWRQAGVAMDSAAMRSFMESQSGMVQPVVHEPGKAFSPVVVSFTPDGKQLSVAGSSTVWDTIAGAPRAGTQNAGTQPSSVTIAGEFAAFSPDGRLTAERSIDNSGSTSILIKEVVTGRAVQTIVLGKRTVAIPVQVQGFFPGRREYPLTVSHIAFNSLGVVVQYCEPPQMGEASKMIASGVVSQTEQMCHVKTFDPVTAKELQDISQDRRSDVRNSQSRTLSSGGQIGRAH